MKNKYVLIYIKIDSRLYILYYHTMPFKTTLQMPTGISTNRPLQKDQSFVMFMKNHQGDTVMSFNQGVGGWEWFNAEQHKESMTHLGNYVDKGILKLDKNNNKTYEWKGQKWYAMVFNMYDPETGEIKDAMDLGTWMIFDTMVDGFSYYYKNEKDRDNMFKYMKKKENKRKKLITPTSTRMSA